VTRVRENILFVDRVGYDRYRLPDGAPVLDPGRYRVTLITRPEVAHQARPGECAEILALDINDHPLRDALAATAHRHRPFERVLVFTEGLLLPIARLREQLGVPGPSVEEITPFRHKPAMKRAAERGGLPVAAWAPVNSAEEARPLLEKYGKVVIKPAQGSGSAAIRIVSSGEELATLDNDPGCDLTDSQAEQFIDAPMLHVDAVVRRGRLHTVLTSRYLSSTLSHTTGNSLVSVTVDDRELRRRTEDFTRRVIDVFAVRDSVLHLELFLLEDGRLVFNEVACRAGGAGVIPAVRAITGVSLYESMVRLALDQDPATGYPRYGPAGGWLVHYGREGVVDRIDDAAVPTDWLVERRLAAEPGERFTPTGLSGSGLVTYVVTGDGERQVRERLQAVEASVRVHYADARPGEGQ
jgi:hypothetical protein